MTHGRSERLREFISLGREMGLWKRGVAFEHYCRYQLFRHLDFSGKRMLEIGCGAGKYSVWASIMGAEKIVALEPSAEGSGEFSSITTLRSLTSRLGIMNIHILEQTFQDFQSEDESFDIILSHYSINHLNEEKCVALAKDPAAWEYYLLLFKKMNRILKSHGIIVVVDCTNRSFWSDLGLRNPFSPTIQWFKHHPPLLWVRLLESAGFRSPNVSWIYDNRFLHLGSIFKNRSASYFWTSMFRLEMTKP